jgi:predicted NAD/FAD-dependent oxidoreductase
MGKEGVIESLVVGAGVSGAVLCAQLHIPCYDKARFPGGRTSTSRNEKELPGFDKGATVLHKELQYKQNGITQVFQLDSFLQNLSSTLEVENIRGFQDKFYCKMGMNSIVLKLLENEAIHLQKKLTSVRRVCDHWELLFEESDPIFVKKLILTMPIPQVISVMGNSLGQEWNSFLQPYQEYRPCLTITGIWKNIPHSITDPIHKLANFTFLESGKDLEYISIESEKYPNEHDICITLQMGEEFSQKNISNWMEDDKFPTPFAIQCSKSFFPSILKTRGIPLYQEPDFLRVHKWRFSQPVKSVFPTEGPLDFDSSIWKQYLYLCKSTSLVITGDWVFGKRVINTILGSWVLAKSL